MQLAESKTGGTPRTGREGRGLGRSYEADVKGIRDLFRAGDRVPSADVARARALR